MDTLSTPNGPIYTDDGKWLLFRQRLPQLDSHHVELLLDLTRALASPLRYAFSEGGTVMLGEYPLGGAVDARVAEIQLRRRLEWDWPRTTVPGDADVEAALTLTPIPFQRTEHGWNAATTVSESEETLRVEAIRGGARVQILLGQIPDEALTVKVNSKFFSRKQQELKFARIEVLGENYYIASEAAADSLAHELPHAVDAVEAAYQLLARPAQPTLPSRGYWRSAAQDEWPRKLF